MEKNYSIRHQESNAQQKIVKHRIMCTVAESILFLSSLNSVVKLKANSR